MDEKKEIKDAPKRYYPKFTRIYYQKSESNGETKTENGVKYQHRTN